MVYFLPVIPAVDPGPDGSGSLIGILLVVNLFFNAVPCALTALALWRTARWRGILRCADCPGTLAHRPVAGNPAVR